MDQANSLSPSVRVGIDIGGTFTDFVIYNPAAQKINTFKLLSTPGDPSEAVLRGIKMIRNQQMDIDPVIHGSTVATNALLEHKGAVTALITTRGFRDILQIGRQNRPALYDFFSEPTPPLVRDEFRFEVDERVDHRGEILIPLKIDHVDDLIPILREKKVESVAVCLLFSFLHPDHERKIAERLRSEGFFVSSSNEILPEFREYERLSTTVVNAYVSPVLDKYMSRLEDSLSGDSGILTHLRVMQSNGGQISIGEARRNGVRCILSGPAGGVIGSVHIARSVEGQNDRKMGEKHTPVSPGASLKLITFDMGGTSTDVSLVNGDPEVTNESILGGYPIRIPVLDIHTIGAGGGSIASVDPGGALQVGPESAGADPGPACYGRGFLPTVTDANLVLGRLSAKHFWGGEIVLDPQRAWDALTHLGNQLGLNPVETALGVIEIVNTHMERALRLISVERGHDPRDFFLISFGGAGGLHATDLARRLEIPRVLISPLASTLSAFGMLCADVVKDYSQTVMFSGDTTSSQIDNALAPMVSRGFQEVVQEGFEPGDILIERFLDMRYVGQSFELRVPWSDDLPNFHQSFHEIHSKTYGYARVEAPIEIVNVRVRAIGKITPPSFTPLQRGSSSPDEAFSGIYPVVLGSTAGAREDNPGNHHISPGELGVMDIPFYQYEKLNPGNHLRGPAIILRSDTTILLGPQDQARVDPFQNMIIQVSPVGPAHRRF
ncbi:MAG: hydantoinase/oxoprolinase family protein [Omnitrophica WOR_2 bacterium]